MEGDDDFRNPRIANEVGRYLVSFLYTTVPTLRIDVYKMGTRYNLTPVFV